MKSNPATDSLLKETMRRLASNLEIARIANGLTQGELAKRAELSRPTISQLEGSGDATPNPSISTLLSLSQALNIPVSLLLISKDEMQALSGVNAPRDPEVDVNADGAQTLNPETARMIEWLNIEDDDERQKRIRHIGQRLKLEEETGMSSLNKRALTAAAIGSMMIPGGLFIASTFGAMSALLTVDKARKSAARSNTSRTTTDHAASEPALKAAQPVSSAQADTSPSAQTTSAEQPAASQESEADVQDQLQSVLAAMEKLQAQVKELQNTQAPAQNDKQ